MSLWEMASGASERIKSASLVIPIVSCCQYHWLPGLWIPLVKNANSWFIDSERFLDRFQNLIVVWMNHFWDNRVQYTDRHLPGVVHTWTSRGQHWHRDQWTSIIYYSKNIKQWMYSYIIKTAEYFTWATDSMLTENTSLQHFLHAFTLCVINKTLMFRLISNIQPSVRHGQTDGDSTINITLWWTKPHSSCFTSGGWQWKTWEVKHKHRKAWSRSFHRSYSLRYSMHFFPKSSSEQNVYARTCQKV